MDKKILTFNTYAGALEHTVAAIKRRTVNLSQRHILLVPEKDTLKCEQMLFGGGGAMDVEVYSLSRWFYKLGGGNVLPTSGAVMILKDILFKTELKCFFRSKGFSGFCSKLFDTLCELDIAGIDLSVFSALPEKKLKGLKKTGGALGLKLEDLTKISAAFKQRTQGMYVGRAGKIRLITEKLNANNFLQQAHVYAANWGRLSAVEHTLFNLIASKAKSFMMTEVASDLFISNLSYNNDTEYNRIRLTANTEVYKASSDIAGIKAAASRIRSLAVGGENFSDMCLIMPSSAAEQAKRIFNEYEIPFYADKSTVLSQSRLAEYLTLLIDLRRQSRKGFICLSKNRFSGISPTDSDIFENYVSEFLIDYKGFSAPFTLMDEDTDLSYEEKRLKIAEEVRKALYNKVNAFWQNIDLLTSQGGLCKLLKDTLDAVDGDSPQKQRLFTVIDTLQRFLCTDDNVETTKSTATLDENLNKSFNDAAAYKTAPAFTKKRIQFLLDAFKEGIMAESLSALPMVQGCVLAGDAGIFKGSRFKHTFVVGFNEGVIPQSSSSVGLVSDDECRLLNLMGLSLKTVTDINIQKEFEFMQLLAASDNVFLAYTHSAESRPSPLLYEVLSLSQNAAQSGAEYDRLILSVGSDEQLIRLVGGKNSALELMILNKDTPSRLLSALFAILGHGQDNPLDSLIKNSVQADKASNKISGLFFKDKTVSVSQLQKYFSCPYLHFVEYGLKAKRRKSGRASMIDIGNAVHKVNELFVLSGFDESKLNGLADEVLCKGVYRLEANARLKEKLKKEIVDTCSQFGKLIKRGKFSEYCSEIRFGKKIDTKADFFEQNCFCKKDNKTGFFRQNRKSLTGCDINGITLKGSIDYADIFDGYIRIIDYKTNNTVFSQKDLYYGSKLQLPLYMLTMTSNGFMPAAMLYFVFKNKWQNEDIRFSGVFLNEKEVLYALDKDMQDTGENAAVNAKITACKNGERLTGSGAEDSATINAYLNYAQRLAALACKQIEGGNISPSPLKTERCACEWCGFLPACGFNGSPRIAAAASVIQKSNDGE